MNGYEAIAKAIKIKGQYRRQDPGRQIKTKWLNASERLVWDGEVLYENDWEVRDMPPPVIDWSRVRVGAKGTTRDGEVVTYMGRLENREDPYVWAAAEHVDLYYSRGVWHAKTITSANDIVSIESYGPEPCRCCKHKEPDPEPVV